jgi:hypothetical protein
MFIYTDTYSLENVFNSRIRSFLHANGYPTAVVSRDLASDNTPDVFVWSRSLGAAVEVMDGFQWETFSISVTCADTEEKGGREISSELSALLIAYLKSREVLGGPITNLEARSGVIPTSGLDGLSRAAYTFSISVYQTANKLTV